MVLAAGPAPAKATTSTVPIVAAAVGDAVQMGLVPSMARPGGNITGISSFSGELVARRLQLLKDFAPQGQRVAVLAIPTTWTTRPTCASRSTASSRRSGHR